MARDSEKRQTSRRKFLKTAIATTPALAFGVGTTSAKQDDELLPVPAGKWVPESKIKAHKKAGLDLASKQSGKASTKVEGKGNAPNRPFPEVDGWAANTNAALSDGKEFQYMIGDFECPAKPSTYDSSVVHFFFPAFQNDGSPTTILQPVLAWNWGTNTDWELAAWWGPDDNGDYHHSSFVDVKPGDTIGGYISKMDYQSSGASDWYVEIWNKRTDTYTDIITDVLDRGEFRYAYTAFELYNFTEGQCSKLPGDCDYSNMYFENLDGNEVTLNWDTWQRDIGCYLDVYAPSSAETYIDL